MPERIVDRLKIIHIDIDDGIGMLLGYLIKILTIIESGERVLIDLVDVLELGEDDLVESPFFKSLCNFLDTGVIRTHVAKGEDRDLSSGDIYSDGSFCAVPFYRIARLKSPGVHRSDLIFIIDAETILGLQVHIALMGILIPNQELAITRNIHDVYSEIQIVEMIIKRFKGLEKFVRLMKILFSDLLPEALDRFIAKSESAHADILRWLGERENIADEIRDHLRLLQYPFAIGWRYADLLHLSHNRKEVDMHGPEYASKLSV